MVIYSQMTDQQIREYREKSIEEANEREKEWKEHHKDAKSSRSTKFDITHSVTVKR